MSSKVSARVESEIGQKQDSNSLHLYFKYLVVEMNKKISSNNNNSNKSLNRTRTAMQSINSLARACVCACFLSAASCAFSMPMPFFPSMLLLKFQTDCSRRNFTMI